MDRSTLIHRFLAVLGALFLLYGLYCFVRPGFLAEAAGVSGTSATGVAELRAMYGGLQAAMGVLLLAAARDPRLELAGLAALAFVMPGLATARLGAAIFAGAWSAYTVGALAFELLTSAAAVALFRERLAAAAGKLRA